MENFKIYENMDKLNYSVLEEFTKKGAPRGKSYVVNCDGVEFKVKTKFTGFIAQVDGYDAYAAIPTVFTEKPDPATGYLKSRPEIHYPIERFRVEELEQLSTQQCLDRSNFLLAIANIINNQEHIEAIVRSAPRKKNGMLHRGRLTKIASSGIAGGERELFALVGRAKSDDTMIIEFWYATCSATDNDSWAKDFASTFHPDLKISEVVQKLF